jgi:hypothetical protein
LVSGTPTSSLLLTPQQSPVPAAEQQLQQSPYSSTPTQLLPKGQTTDWTIEDVIQFIAITDPTLAIHADLFRKHVSVSNNFLVNFMPLNSNFLPGNRWQSPPAPQLRHDDEVHGPQVGSSPENLQFGESGQGSSSHADLNSMNEGKKQKLCVNILSRLKNQR